MNRRRFLQVASAASASLAARPLLRARPAPDRLRTALVGCGWWGNNILREAMASGGCRIVGLADVDARALASTQARVRQGTGDEPRLFRDFRELLADARPEVVIVATPDHWHALPAIAAMRAGAHVYVEKPIGHTIGEGQAMVATARATRRVVQVGTHRRISPHNISAREFIRSGRLGDLGMVRCFVNYGGDREQPQANTPAPAELDWDYWCGPAPLRPHNAGIHPRGFRHYLDFANGMLGDWGIHWLDQVLWITGEKAPTQVYSTGGRPIAGPAVCNDREMTSDAPDHQLATYRFDRFNVQWEHRRFAGHLTDKGENVGCYFHGTLGTLHLGWMSGWTFYPMDPKAEVVTFPARLNEPDAQNIREHWANFLGAIHTGAAPVSDLAGAHRSTTMALLGMLSMRLGRSVDWDGERERVPGDEAVNTLLRRPYRAPWLYPVA